MRDLLLRIKSARPKSRGQSLVELAIVLGLLLYMMVAIVEYGFLLNRYLNLLDAAREAARFGSNVDPFDPQTHAIDPNFFVRPDLSQPPNSTTNQPGLADMVEDYMQPITLDPTRDDIVISFFSVNGSNIVRFPTDAPTGWSRYGNAQSHFSDQDIINRLDANAPATGVLVVEVFYTYHSLLHLPLFPETISVYTYSIMPLSAAEPTPTAMP